MNSKQFYTFYTRLNSRGMRFVNINNIASIEDLKPGIRVTLNVIDKNKEAISFDCDMAFGTTTGQIIIMDDAHERLDKIVSVEQV